MKMVLFIMPHNLHRYKDSGNVETEILSYKEDQGDAYDIWSKDFIFLEK